MRRARERALGASRTIAPRRSLSRSRSAEPRRAVVVAAPQPRPPPVDTSKPRQRADKVDKGDKSDKADKADKRDKAPGKADKAVRRQRSVSKEAKPVEAAGANKDAAVPDKSDGGDGKAAKKKSKGRKRKSPKRSKDSDGAVAGDAVADATGLLASEPSTTASAGPVPEVETTAVDSDDEEAAAVVGDADDDNNNDDEDDGGNEEADGLFGDNDDDDDGPRGKLYGEEREGTEPSVFTSDGDGGGGDEAAPPPQVVVAPDVPPTVVPPTVDAPPSPQAQKPASGSRSPSPVGRSSPLARKPSFKTAPTSGRGDATSTPAEPTPSTPATPAATGGAGTPPPSRGRKPVLAIASPAVSSSSPAPRSSTPKATSVTRLSSSSPKPAPMTPKGTSSSTAQQQQRSSSLHVAPRPVATPQQRSSIVGGSKLGTSSSSSASASAGGAAAVARRSVAGDSDARKSVGGASPSSSRASSGSTTPSGATAQPRSSVKGAVGKRSSLGTAIGTAAGGAAAGGAASGGPPKLLPSHRSVRRLDDGSRVFVRLVVPASGGDVVAQVEDAVTGKTTSLPLTVAAADVANADALSALSKRVTVSRASGGKVTAVVAPPPASSASLSWPDRPLVRRYSTLLLGATAAAASVPVFVLLRLPSATARSMAVAVHNPVSRVTSTASVDVPVRVTGGFPPLSPQWWSAVTATLALAPLANGGVAIGVSPPRASSVPRPLSRGAPSARMGTVVSGERLLLAGALDGKGGLTVSAVDVAGSGHVVAPVVVDVAALGLPSTHGDVNDALHRAVPLLSAKRERGVLVLALAPAGGK